ncbi:hypothetical protein CDL15_Pgr011915 [Punica granatum]|uniref:Uncharacterized protein n=1 Tax=Punica granatum TaxID=22663 RepID=A0A218WD87_PUNGR|nr:hypothetical protein CDL15_Pgr011915 [Punica granatum]
MLTWYESAWDVEATTNVGGRRGAPEREDYESLDLNSDCAYDSAMASVVRRSSHDWAFRSEAVLWVGLTLGTKAHLVSMESEDRTWLSHRDGHHFSLVMWTVVYVECAWLMLPPNVLICRRPALLPGQSCFVGALSLGRCVFDLPEANLVTGAVAHCSARCRPCWDGCALLKACFAAGMRVFALAIRMRSHFRMPQCEASKAPIGHARAYRDILNDALTALSIIRRARRLKTLLVRIS